MVSDPLKHFVIILLHGLLEEVVKDLIHINFLSIFFLLLNMAFIIFFMDVILIIFLIVLGCSNLGL
jgi:hypothetical protein